jgi:hypothetical protein
MWLLDSGFPAISISTSLVVAGVSGFMLSHGGSLRRVIEDLQLVMIGPAWALSVVYKRFGIPI